MGKSIEDCIEAKEWVDLFDAIDVNKKGSLNMKGTITEHSLMFATRCSPRNFEHFWAIFAKSVTGSKIFSPVKLCEIPRISQKPLQTSRNRFLDQKSLHVDYTELKETRSEDDSFIDEGEIFRLLVTMSPVDFVAKVNPRSVDMIFWSIEVSLKNRK